MEARGSPRSRRLWRTALASRGEPSGSIGFSVDHGCLTLRYIVNHPNEGSRPRSQQIPIDRTRCNFGGIRPWFRCAACNRRVAVLYGVTLDYLCRHCYGLAYGNQQERELERILRRVREIRKRLGASENLMEGVHEKPRGMHWRTFERLVAEQSKLIASYDQAVVMRFGIPV